MSSNCLNDDNHSLSWYNLKLFLYKKKLSYINVQFSLKTLTYHNNFHTKNDFLQD
jgi:hypothetical protein